MFLPAFEALRTAKRPLFIFGYGIRDSLEEAREVVGTLNIPVVTTWGARDLFPDCVGGFGTHGTRPANFCVQNADYILTIGTRLDTKATGSPASGFAPKAQVFMVDIDQFELGKMTRIGRPVWTIHSEAKKFLNDFLGNMLALSSHDLNAGTWRNPEWAKWRERINGWKEKYPSGQELNDGVNPYEFVKELGQYLTKDDVIVSDTGNSLACMMQSYPFKGETFIHAFNQTPMGYGLPAAVGACFARDSRVVLVSGDGGLAVNITELATVVRHNLDLKIILFNNKGHGMCRQTQRSWLGGSYPSTSCEGGLACPDYSAVAQAYGIPLYATARDMLSLDQRRYLRGPGFLNLNIGYDYQVTPQVRAGKNLENAEPFLPAEELAEIMR